MPLFHVSRSVAVADDSFNVFAVVPGPVPKDPPVINNINSGRVFTTTDPVQVRGTCPPDTLVKVFKNDIFAGATLCQNGTFGVSMDLFIGDNNLVARAYNTNDAASPDSLPVSVRLAPPGINTNGTTAPNVANIPANQFYLTSEIFYRGVEAGKSLKWPLILSGGEQPYAVSVSWGDGETKLISRMAPGRFDISHVYDGPGRGEKGSYTVVVKATDQAGNDSFLQLVVIVSGGTPGVAGVVESGYNWATTLRLAWQLLAVAVLVVLAFWLGERREAHIMRSRQAGHAL